jgi:hypothetical protein
MPKALILKGFNLQTTSQAGRFVALFGAALCVYSASASGAVLTVKKDGSGNYTTIQACANAAQAGDTCLVDPGTYDEIVVTRASGASDAARVTFKAQGLVRVRGFALEHQYVTVDGFDITGSNWGYDGYIDIRNLNSSRNTPGGHHCAIFNNAIHDGDANVYGIKFADAVNACVIRGNTLNNLLYMFLGIQGGNHLVENNRFLNQNGWDFIRLFGHDHIFRRNMFQHGIPIPGQGNHPDFVQTFANDNLGESYNHLFEENWIEDMDSQLGQMNNGFINSVGLAVPFHDVVFRNNVFISISDNWNISFPRVQFLHNTFYHTSYKLSGLIFGGSLTRGSSAGAVVMNNVFLAGGPEGRNDSGFYGNDGSALSREVLQTAMDATTAAAVQNDLVANGYLVNTNGRPTAKAVALSSINNFVLNAAYSTYKQTVYDMLTQTAFLFNQSTSTFVADYNYAAGYPSAGYPAKRTSECTGPVTDFNFCESHGVNGGDPQFQNLSNPLGPDGLPFTLDDGLKPRPGSPLCGRGQGGRDIGLYSCDTSKVFAGPSSGVVFPPPGSSCDLNNDNVTSIADVQLCVNQAIGAVGCTSGDINRDALCNVLDVQRVVNAIFSGTCLAQ